MTEAQKEARMHELQALPASALESVLTCSRTHSLTFFLTHPPTRSLTRSLTHLVHTYTHLLATCYVSQAFVQSCVAASQTRCERGGAHHPELLSFLFTSK